MIVVDIIKYILSTIYVPSIIRRQKKSVKERNDRDTPVRYISVIKQQQQAQQVNIIIRVVAWYLVGSDCRVACKKRRDGWMWARGPPGQAIDKKKCDYQISYIHT